MTYASPNLDVLRSLAVIFVVVSHLLLEKSVVKVGGYHIQTLGTLGVLIFFVHTCLVLMQSLERQAKTHRSHPAAVPFLIGRACRIYPLSIVVVILISSIEWMHDTQPTLLTILSNLFLVQNLTGNPSVTPVLWSLPFEIQMYCFLPVIYLMVRRGGRSAPYYTMVLWGACVVLVYIFWRMGWNSNLIRFFPCFLPGVLAFCLRHSLRSLPSTVLFVYVGVAALAYPLMVGRGASATVLSWMICLGLGLLIPRCREIKSPLLQVCGSVIARYSYGIYLVHVPVLYFSFHYLTCMSPLVSWTIFIGGVACLSYFAYHFIEKPGIEMGRALVERLNADRGQADHQRRWSNF